MKQFTLLLALFAFLAVGCTEETEIETPSGDEIEVEDDLDAPDVDMPDMEAEMDSLGENIEEGADATEDAVDDALDGDADGDGQ
jgi:hypothetical protein